MKLPAIFITLLLSTFYLLADDKKDVLKVKINHEYTIGSAGDDIRPGSGNPFRRQAKPTIQFNYDSKEILQITNKKEIFYEGVFLLRHEAKGFKKLTGKMLKLCDTLLENKITGVKKKYNSADESTIMSAYTEVDRPENADANKKDNIIIHFEYFANPKTAKSYAENGGKKINQAYRQTWTYPELQELVKVFDERTAEVFKKYDLLKSLND